MGKNRNHGEWMAAEFSRLKSKRKLQYRKAYLHASLIEGVICSKSKTTRRGVYHAVEWLHIHKKIKDEERDAFHDVGKARNKLVHEIGSEGASEKEILHWRDDLIDKVLKAYWMSDFLKEEIFTKYNIKKEDLPKPRPAA